MCIGGIAGEAAAAELLNDDIIIHSFVAYLNCFIDTIW
jgi:hypothetical protein